METALLLTLGLVTAAVGAVGGLGGAVLLVPALVFLGWEPAGAAPLGLLTVAAGSLAAAREQVETLNHRLGVSLEVAASAGAILGAVASAMFSTRVLVLVLAVTAAAAGLLSGLRSGVRNAPDPHLGLGAVGERAGELAGAYELSQGVVPYRAKRTVPGLAVIGAVGLVAGLTGVSGGFMKTPVMSELMHIPTKVAASTTVFMVGITAASALPVYALQGRIEVVEGAAVVLGALLGGKLGARLQAMLPPTVIRRGFSVLLVVIGVILLAQS